MRRRHAYTSADIPWSVDEGSDDRLLRYLRGGGIRAFGSTCSMVMRARRQNRFLACSALAGIVYLVLFFV